MRIEKSLFSFEKPKFFCHIKRPTEFNIEHAESLDQLFGKAKIF